MSTYSTFLTITHKEETVLSTGSIFQIIMYADNFARTCHHSDKVVCGWRSPTNLQVLTSNGFWGSRQKVKEPDFW